MAWLVGDVVGDRRFVGLPALHGADVDDAPPLPLEHVLERPPGSQKVAFSIQFKASCQAASLSSATGAKPEEPPALLTRMSILPKRSTAASTTASTSCCTRTSPATNRGPFTGAHFLEGLLALFRRPPVHQHTGALRQKGFGDARPMPRVPPVMTATLPSSCMSMSPLPAPIPCRLFLIRRLRLPLRNALHPLMVVLQRRLVAAKK